MKNALIIMCGYPYSGKTTLAKFLEKELGFERITIDEVVLELGLPIEEELLENEWTRVYSEAESRLISLLTNGHSVIFDATNGHKDYRDKLRKITRSLAAETMVVFVNIPLETIYSRHATVANRHKAVGMEDTVSEFNIPAAEEKVIIIDQSWDNNKCLGVIKEVFLQN